MSGIRPGELVSRCAEAAAARYDRAADDNETINMAAEKPLKLAVDIGGTFTDVMAVQGDRVSAAKVLSTPEDLSVGVMSGIEAAVSQLGARVADIAFVVHATTAATNALLERRGARVGLIVTDGFRDILEIGRQRRFDPYDLQRPKLAPLVPRERVVEVPERLDAGGNILIALDEAAVRAAFAVLRAQDVDAIAVSFIHAYRDPRHEQRVLELATADLIGAETAVFASHRIAPEAREFERTSTTVIAAYLAPVVGHYLQALAEKLEAGGASRRYWVMKSSGGLFDSEVARAHPEELVESGPAAGVIGAASVARDLGIPDIISFDMGGTTAKASLIHGGVPAMNYEYEVGGAAHAGGFLQKGTGHPLRVPVIDLAEVGTGGGSIAWIDEGGALRVGPRSAGASPGPVCYGRGGTEPTVTDADLVLGYLDEVGSGQYLGRMSLDAARDAIKTRIADPLGMSVEVAARGIFDLANAQMADAVRLVSVAKGVDPRELTLVAFGGAGPVHAWAIAQQLLIGTILIPPHPGVYSAVGLLGADFRVDLSRGVRVALAGTAAGADLSQIFSLLATEATKEMLSQGHAADSVEIRYAADMRYVGQSYEVNVGLPVRAPVDTEQAQAAFHAEHARLYGHASEGEPVEVITVRVSASTAGAPPSLAGDAPPAAPLQHRTRDLSFEGAVLPTQVHSRAGLGAVTDGPAAIEQSDTTIIVPPGALVRRLENGCLRLELKGSPT